MYTIYDVNNCFIGEVKSTTDMPRKEDILVIRDVNGNVQTRIVDRVVRTFKQDADTIDTTYEQEKVSIFTRQTDTKY